MRAARVQLPRTSLRGDTGSVLYCVSPGSLRTAAERRGARALREARVVSGESTEQAATPTGRSVPSFELGRRGHKVAESNPTQCRAWRLAEGGGRDDCLIPDDSWPAALFLAQWRRGRRGRPSGEGGEGVLPHTGLCPQSHRTARAFGAVLRCSGGGAGLDVDVECETGG